MFRSASRISIRNVRPATGRLGRARDCAEGHVEGDAVSQAHLIEQGLHFQRRIGEADDRLPATRGVQKTVGADALAEGPRTS
jgi:hypothetical protein